MLISSPLRNKVNFNQSISVVSGLNQEVLSLLSLSMIADSLLGLDQCFLSVSAALDVLSGLHQCILSSVAQDVLSGFLDYKTKYSTCTASVKTLTKWREHVVEIPSAPSPACYVHVDCNKPNGKLE